jgi:hypothetical protein
MVNLFDDQAFTTARIVRKEPHMLRQDFRRPGRGATERGEAALDARPIPDTLRRRAASVGNLVYLAAVGVVATAIAGVFFTAGFLLLAPPGGATISSFHARAPELQDRSSGPVNSPPAGRGSGPEAGKLGVAAIAPPIPAAGGAPALQSFTVAPLSSFSEPIVTAAADMVPDGLSPGTELATNSVLALSAKSEPAAASLPAIAAVPTPPDTRLSAAEIANLLEHGDAMLRNADVTSARLFYERAAAGGDGRAALRLGATFDPAFLDRAGLRNVKGDAAEASLWYGRALDLGMAEAKRQLSGGDAKRGR